MDEFEDTMKNIASRQGLMLLLAALQEHKDFWAGWLTLRTGPMGEIIATKEECEAAQALQDALLEWKKGFDTLEKLGVSE